MGGSRGAGGVTGCGGSFLSHWPHVRVDRAALGGEEWPLLSDSLLLFPGSSAECWALGRIYVLAVSLFLCMSTKIVKMLLGIK